MSAQGPGGPTRPARLTGLILIGVAVVAVGIGVFTLSSNGSSPPSAGRAAATTAAIPGQATQRGTKPATKLPAITHPSISAPSTQPPTTSGVPAGQTTTVAPPPPTGAFGAPTAAAIGVRVYNNSLIKDLAETGADDLRNAGFNVVFVGNYADGVIDTTTVYYSPTAPGEQQVANQIAQEFGMRVAPRFPGIAFASPGVIVILTKDFHPPTK